MTTRGLTLATVLLGVGALASGCAPPLTAQPRFAPPGHGAAGPTPAQATLGGEARASVLVQGVPVPAAVATTVAAALAAAGVHPRYGRLLSVVTHESLGRRVPARLYVNGRRAAPGTVVAAGDRVTARPGEDRVEDVRTVRRPLSEDPTGAGVHIDGRRGTLRQVVGTVSGTVVSRRVVHPSVPAHGKRRARVLLTFDDGPSPGATGRVLALLAAHHVRAVFCMVGSEARARPALVRRVVAAGHVLCDHTQDHDEHLERRDAQTRRADIARCAASVASAAGGVRPRFFRAPGGNWSPELEAEARAQHMTPLKWTVDPWDWARPGSAAITARVLAQLGPGGVILLHDGGGERAQTVAALRVLLERIPHLGYRFADPSPAQRRQDRRVFRRRPAPTT